MEFKIILVSKVTFHWIGAFCEIYESGAGTDALMVAKQQYIGGSWEFFFLTFFYHFGAPSPWFTQMGWLASLLTERHPTSATFPHQDQIDFSNLENLTTQWRKRLPEGPFHSSTSCFWPVFNLSEVIADWMCLCFQNMATTSTHCSKQALQTDSCKADTGSFKSYTCHEPNASTTCSPLIIMPCQKHFLFWRTSIWSRVLFVCQWLISEAMTGWRQKKRAVYAFMANNKFLLISFDKLESDLLFFFFFQSLNQDSEGNTGK